MYCPRLTHFRRIMPDGQIGLCGHMVDGKKFKNFDALEKSTWLFNVADSMKQDQWPIECRRCRDEEDIGHKSMRMNAIDRHSILSKMRDDYLIIGGVLDNICNAACQFCNENLSTKIGSLLHGKDYKLFQNVEAFKSLPQDRILELDINGGEPSNSPNYAALLRNPPVNVRIIRINTNASRYMDEIESLLDKKIKVIVTMSLDGTGQVYEYARWPLRWNTFTKVVDQYRALRDRNTLLSLDFWSSVSSYTVGDLSNIRSYAQSVEVDLSIGFIKDPAALDVTYSNFLTIPHRQLGMNIATREDNTKDLMDYLQLQDSLRGTNYEDCYNRS